MKNLIAKLFALLMSIFAVAGNTVVEPIAEVKNVPTEVVAEATAEVDKAAAEKAAAEKAAAEGRR